MATNKKRMKVIVCLLSLVMVFTVIPQFSIAAHAETVSSIEETAIGDIPCVKATVIKEGEVVYQKMTDEQCDYYTLKGAEALMKIEMEKMEATKSGSSYEYRTYLHKDKIKYKNGGWKKASGQLEGGYRGLSHLYYSESGGGTYSLSVSFPAPWGGVSVSAAYGRGSKNNIGGLVEVPDSLKGIHVIIKAKKTYKFTPYSLQKRKKGTKKWTTYATGVGKYYYSLDVKCVAV